MGQGKRAVFADQIALCHNEYGWYPTIQDALDGLSLQQAVWKEGNNHSIAELVSHLTYWNERWLRRFQGDAVGQPHNNEVTFEAATGSVEQWKEQVQRLMLVLTEWKQELLACEEAKLEEGIPGDDESSWWEALTCLTTHNAYHLGQMLYIRKQQGSWSQ